MVKFLVLMNVENAIILSFQEMCKATLCTIFLSNVTFLADANGSINSSAEENSKTTILISKV